MSASQNVTRIAATSTVRHRYVINCVISALFRDERVLLVSLDPARDPYSAEIGNLRGRVFHPDHDKLPRDSGSVGANLDYVCWAPAFERHTATADDCSRLIGHLNFESNADALGRQGPLLVVLDGCQFLEDKAHAPHAEEIRRALRDCVAAGHQVVVAGENDWDSQWLTGDGGTMSLPPHGTTGFRLPGEFFRA